MTGEKNGGGRREENEKPERIPRHHQLIELLSREPEKSKWNAASEEGDLRWSENW